VDSVVGNADLAAEGHDFKGRVLRTIHHGLQKLMTDHAIADNDNTLFTTHGCCRPNYHCMKNVFTAEVLSMHGVCQSLSGSRSLPCRAYIQSVPLPSGSFLVRVLSGRLIEVRF